MEGMSSTPEKNRLPIYEECTTCIINLERRPDRLKIFEDRCVIMRRNIKSF